MRTHYLLCPHSAIVPIRWYMLLVLLSQLNNFIKYQLCVCVCDCVDWVMLFTFLLTLGKIGVEQRRQWVEYKPITMSGSTRPPHCFIISLYTPKRNFHLPVMDPNAVFKTCMSPMWNYSFFIFFFLLMTHVLNMCRIHRKPRGL